MRMFLYFKRREKRGKREAPRPRFLVLRRKTLSHTFLLCCRAIIERLLKNSSGNFEFNKNSTENK